MKFRLPAFVCAGLASVTLCADTKAGWNSVAHVMCGDGPIRRALRGGSTYDEPRRVAQKPAVEYETVTRYEPYTVMRPERVEEPVDVRVSNYVWEPVESFVRRSYYDPCTGEYQQVDVPKTSYVRKLQVRTETRYLQKVRMVPVEMTREVTESRPVYTYYGPVTKKYGPAYESSSGPSINEIRNQGPETYAPIRNPNVPVVPNEMKKIDGVRNTQPQPQRAPQTQQSEYRFNAMSTSLSKPVDGHVFAEVFQSDRTTPVSQAKVVFVSTTDTNTRHYVTADAFGGVDTKLPAGEWYVYAGPGDGKANLINKLKVEAGETVRPLIPLK